MRLGIVLLPLFFLVAVACGDERAEPGQYLAYVMQESLGEVAKSPLLRVIDLTTREVVDLGQGEQPAWRPQARVP